MYSSGGLFPGTTTFDARWGRLVVLAVFAFLYSVSVSASQGSLWGSSSESDSKASGFNLFAQEEPEFLPVDEAFKFESSVNDSNQLVIQWDISEGYYLYESRLTVKDAAGNKLDFSTIEGASIEKDDPAFGLVQVYYNRWGVTVEPAVAGEVSVRYQGCADAGLCYPPTRKKVLWEALQPSDLTAPSDQNLSSKSSSSKSSSSNSLSSQLESSQFKSSQFKSSSGLNLETTQADSGIDALTQGNFFLTLLIFLGIGIGLAFTPCVLPMLPILSSVVVNHQGRNKNASFLAATAYILGMAVTYSVLGVVMAGFGDAVQMQAWLQQPLVVGIFAALFVSLALAMFGVYELQLPEVIRHKLTGVGDGSKNHGLLGCVILGAISALVVSPCVSGPLAGVLIYISTTQDMLLGGAALFAMALGMGMPLMAVVLGGKNILPRAGVWMEQVKAVFGVLLLLMALYLVKHLVAAELLAIMVAVILLVFTIWAGVLESVTNSIYRGVLLVIFIYGIALLASGLSGKASFDAPLSFVSSGSKAVAQETMLDVVKVSPSPEFDQLMAQAKQQNKPLMLDVLADWCVSCFVMEKEILVKADVKAMMSGVDVVKVDITDVTDENAQFLKNEGLFGPPAFLFYNGKGEEVGRIVGEVSKQQFEDYYRTLTF